MAFVQAECKSPLIEPSCTDLEHGLRYGIVNVYSCVIVFI
jgi:uncharacterized protein (UPF0179 family)